MIVVGLADGALAADWNRAGRALKPSSSSSGPSGKGTALETASAEKASGTAMKTPVGPSWNFCARSQPSGISSSQKQNRFSSVGVHVSPAPLKAAVMHIPTANSGNPRPIIHKARAPCASTSGSVLKIETIGLARTMKRKADQAERRVL
jgi:hypothetical protein